MCRPLVIADKGVSRVKEHHMKELKVKALESFSLSLFVSFMLLQNQMKPNGSWTRLQVFKR